MVVLGIILATVILIEQMFLLIRNVVLINQTIVWGLLFFDMVRFFGSFTWWWAGFWFIVFLMERYNQGTVGLVSGTTLFQILFLPTRRWGRLAVFTCKQNFLSDPLDLILSLLWCHPWTITEKGSLIVAVIGTDDILHIHNVEGHVHGYDKNA